MLNCQPSSEQVGLSRDGLQGGRNPEDTNASEVEEEVRSEAGASEFEDEVAGGTSRSGRPVNGKGSNIAQSCSLCHENVSPCQTALSQAAVKQQCGKTGSRRGWGGGWRAGKGTGEQGWFVMLSCYADMKSAYNVFSS